MQPETGDGPASADTLAQPTTPPAAGRGPGSPDSDTLSQLTPTSSGEPPPTTVGPYRVVRQLGRGGMGDVFEAEDPVLNRRMAIKVMRPELAGQPQARARFLREAKAAAGLHHDHIVPIYHVGEAEGGVFIAMPLLAGETLAARLAREPRLRPDEVIQIGRGVAAGLAAAHARGFIHRDIKPSNLWLEATHGGGSRARILDFGLVRSEGPDDGLSQAGAVMGTPSYMSPEQADGRPVDSRSDLFSLGAVLYEAATGTAPFRGTTRSATLRAVADTDPPAPNEVDPAIAPALSAFMLRLLSKDPAGRPPSAEAVVDGLDHIVRGTEPTDVVPVRDAGSGRAVGRRVARLAVAVLVVGLIVAAVWGYRRLTRPVEVVGDPPGVDPGPAVVGAGGDAVPGGSAEPRFTGSLGLHVLRKGSFGGQQFALSDATAPLPVRPDDTYRIRLTVNPPGYVYLVRLTPDGRAVPLYPWTGGRWDAPTKEAPVGELALPAGDGGLPLDGDEGGLETVVAVVRSTPLGEPADRAAAVFGGLPAQRTYRPDRAVAWFENSRLVAGEGTVGLVLTDDPVLQVQDFLSARLQPHARQTFAVSFGRLGRPKSPAAPMPDPGPRAELDRRATGLSEAVVGFSRTGRYADAIAKQQELLKVYDELYPKAEFPDGHPARAAALSGLGTLYYQTGRLAEAEALFRTALEMQRRLLGTDHPETITSSGNLAFVLQAMGKSAEAAQLLEHALRTRRRMMGNDHPTVAATLSNLGVVLRDQGETAKAIERLREATEMWKRLYPPDRYPDGHPSQASSLVNLGQALQEAGKADEARVFFAQALETRQRLYRGDHPEVAAAHRRLGTALRDAKRYPEAIAELETAVAMYRRLYPTDKSRAAHPDLVAALTDLGDTLVRASKAADPSAKSSDPDRIKQAIPILEEAVALAERLYPADRYPSGHRRLADALAALGSALDQAGQPDRAREYTQRAEVMRGGLGPKKGDKK